MSMRELEVFVMTVYRQVVAYAKRVATRWWISKESYDQNLYSG